MTGRRLRDDPRLILAPGDTLGSGDGVLSLGRERIGVTRLTLTDFRSYSHLRLEADLRSVILTGANGAGKTNLLEALSFLAPGRGLRRAKLSEVTREGAAGGPRGAWAVAARVHGPLGDVTYRHRDAKPASPTGARFTSTARRPAVKAG